MRLIKFIQKPDNNLLSQLKAIWMEAFEDTDEYLNFVLANLPEEVKIVAAIDDGTILGAVYLFPYTIHPGNINAYYGYAGAIKKEYRGNRIFSDIMCYMNNFVRSINAELMTSATDLGLRSLYMHRGYPVIFKCREVAFDLTEIAKDNPCFIDKNNSLERSILTASEWKNMRPELEKGQYYLDPLDSCIDFIIKEKQFCGNVWEKIRIDDLWYSFIGYYVDDTLIVEETSAPENLIIKNGAVLCTAYSVKHIKLHLPCSTKSSLENSVYNSQGTFEGGYLWTPLLID